MSQQMHVSVVILAAGQGTRMKSKLPKVLHPIGGKPLLSHVIHSTYELSPKQIVVVFGHGGEQVKTTLANEDVVWVEQTEQLGTGHAVDQAMPKVDDGHIILVLYGDVPLIKSSTLSELILLASNKALALLTVHLDEPHGYGRIVRDKHSAVERIVEQKDASESDLQITEINTGILAVQGKLLRTWLNKLENNNANGEYYLTDIIAMAVADGVEVKTIHPDTEDEVLGVNSRSQLARLERVFQRECAEKLMLNGATIIDPERIEIRGEVKTGKDVIIDINVVLEGHVQIGDDVYIGPGCVIRDCIIEDGVQIEAMCVLEHSRVGVKTLMGPFSRLRPGVELKGNNKVGNFVEIKNSVIGEGSKVNHLTYIGDTDMGSGVNIGAGTITANYDGAHKHRTTIEDNVSTGSNSVLVAPVKVGKGATIGAGSVITKETPEEKLTLTRAKQITIENWQRPVKKKK